MIGLALMLAAASGDYRDCLMRRSDEFERSGESAADVARSVVTFCVPLESQVTPDSILEKMPLNDRKAHIETTRSAFENLVLLHVVRIRACRKTSGCHVAALPDDF